MCGGSWWVGGGGGGAVSFFLTRRSRVFLSVSLASLPLCRSSSFLSAAVDVGCFLAPCSESEDASVHTNSFPAVVSWRRFVIASVSLLGACVDAMCIAKTQALDGLLLQ